MPFGSGHTGPNPDHGGEQLPAGWQGVIPILINMSRCDFSTLRTASRDGIWSPMAENVSVGRSRARCRTVAQDRIHTRLAVCAHLKLGATEPNHRDGSVHAVEQVNVISPCESPLGGRKGLGHEVFAACCSG